MGRLVGDKIELRICHVDLLALEPSCGSGSNSSQILTVASSDADAKICPNSGWAQDKRHTISPWPLISTHDQEFESEFKVHTLIIRSDEQVAIRFP
jgi:hypothetical protein